MAVVELVAIFAEQWAERHKAIDIAEAKIKNLKREYPDLIFGRPLVDGDKIGFNITIPNWAMSSHAATSRFGPVPIKHSHHTICVPNTRLAAFTLEDRVEDLALELGVLAGHQPNIFRRMAKENIGTLKSS